MTRKDSFWLLKIGNSRPLSVCKGQKIICTEIYYRIKGNLNKRLFFNFGLFRPDYVAALENRPGDDVRATDEVRLPM